jgi:hypothetical protein
VLQWTLFTDAGDVWNRGRSETFQNFSLKVTPGIQMTALTRWDQCGWWWGTILQ